MFIPIFILYIQVFIFTTCTEVDKEWVKKNLQKDYDGFRLKEINSLSVTPAVENAPPLGSEDKRLNFEEVVENGIKMNTSKILKSLPSTPALNKQIADSGLFNREIEVYRDAIPIMEKIGYRLDHHGDLHWVRAHGFREYDQILLEDVIDGGYVLADRFKGLDEDQVLIALRALAEIHALSTVANEENNNKIKQQFDQSHIERKYEVLGDFYTVVYNNFAKLIEEKWGPEWKEAAKKIRELAPQVKEKLRDITVKKDGFINVLNLGAPNFRNTYFIYAISHLAKSDKPLDVKFSYFQLSFFNSPLHDLQYFINTSPNLEIIKNNKADLLDTYYETFTEHLIEFGYKGKIPTKQEFDDEVKRTNFIGLTRAIQILSGRFKPSKPNAAQIAEQFAEQNKNSDTTSLDTSGLYTKEYEDYMKVILKDAIRNKVI